MSRARSILLVARREVLERGRSRAFLLSLVLTVGLILAGAILPSMLGGDRADRVGIVGSPPAAFEPALRAAATQAGRDVEVRAVTDEAAAERLVGDGSLSGALVVPRTVDGTPTWIVRDRTNEVLAQVVTSAWSGVRVQDLLSRHGVDPAELQSAAAPPTVHELQPANPDRQASFLLANVGVILLFIAIFTFGSWVLSGVVEEKQSRVVEVVLSTVEARDLLVGKVLGIGLLGLLQLVLMVAVGLGAAVATHRFELPATTPGAVVQLLVWFVLGYAFYSTALGVLGALASRMEDASSASTPVSMVAMAGYFFSLLVALDQPAGLPARIATFVPPVAPMVVPLRAALGAIEPWEIVGSVALMVITIAGLFVVGGRVYRGAVLRTGARMKLRDAWRAAEG